MAARRRAGTPLARAVALASLLLGPPGVEGAGAATTDAAGLSAERAALRALLAAPGDIRVGGRRLESARLRRFYRERDHAPAWRDADHGAARGRDLLEILATAGDHGLDPGDYHVPAIRTRWPGPDPRTAAEQELLLTDGALRYAADMRAGRLRPRRARVDWALPAGAVDAVGVLAGALREADFRAALASLPPPADGYVRLLEALRQYRAIARDGGWPAVPAGAPLTAGDVDDRVRWLGHRLQAEEGHGRPSREDHFDQELAGAVRRFQARHGLAVDGIVGPATLRALNVPVTARVRQLELNLERWRWLPRELGRRHVTVNAADASLTVVRDGHPVLVSRVVVGDVRHPTPVTRARLTAVVFNPAWNVPMSIAREDMLPRLRVNPRYLADNDIFILDRRDSDPFGLTIDWSAVPPDRFPFRLQQRPGAGNPLGRIKFEMPNRFDVHLHDSPARPLFARPVRTLSHGCVRVEQARALAAQVLEEEPGSWAAAEIEAAIEAGGTRSVALRSPLPVYLLYWTAFVTPDGTVHFRDDVYGRDGRLAAALVGRGSRPAPASALTPADCGSAAAHAVAP